MNEGQTELAHVCFKDVAWLQHFPLTDDSVLDYFAMSQFYERTCNNEVLKMQARFTDNAALLDQLHLMTGVEYAVLESQPPKLFVIAKQQRHSPNRASTMQCFYILDGSVFMAPSLLSIISSRLVNSSHYMDEAWRYAHTYVDYNVASARFVVKDGSLDDKLVAEEDLAAESIVDSVIAAVNKP